MMRRPRPGWRTWPAALARLALLFALLGQVAGAVSANPRSPLPTQAQAILALFGADALCLSPESGDPTQDHGLACVACPAHCAAVAAPGSGPVLAIRRAPVVALGVPPANAPPGPARPQSDLTAHGPPLTA